MKIAFVSNYINHHQIPMADVLYRKLEGGYRFIQTEPMEEERIRQGWNSDTGNIPYLLVYEKEEEECKKWIEESDIVLFGGCEDESYIKPRLDAGKIVLRYTERLYREGQWKAVSPRGLWKKYHDHTKYNNAPVYLLCAGGYVADDFAIIRAYKGKRFKWGYFTEFEPFPKEERIAAKKHEIPHIMWAGRFMELKHSMDVLNALLLLKEKGIPFRMQFVGDGECREEMQAFIREHKMEDMVSLPGFLKPEQVREEMKKANIFLFTSDYREGWGAVVNESMNAGCALVVSHAVGSAPFLIEHEKNGLIYKSRDVKELAACLEKLCTDGEFREKLGDGAYNTIESLWNPECAGSRLLALCEELLQGKMHFESSGPLSEAKVIKQRKMYEYLIGKKHEK